MVQNGIVVGLEKGEINALIQVAHIRNKVLFKTVDFV